MLSFESEKNRKMKNKIGRIFYGIFFALIFYAGFAFGDEAAWQEMNQEVIHLLHDGKKAEGIERAEEALETAQKEFGPKDLRTVESMNNLANLYLLEGRREEAEALYKQSIVIEEEVLGKDASDVADTLYNLAMIYAHRRQAKQARTLLNRALKIKEKQLGKEHPDAAKIRTTLSQLRKLKSTSSSFSTDLK
jgi:tetratricopeptide (TPR) repeat protein